MGLELGLGLVGARARLRATVQVSVRVRDARRRIGVWARLSLPPTEAQVSFHQVGSTARVRAVRLGLGLGLGLAQACYHQVGSAEERTMLVEQLRALKGW